MNRDSTTSTVRCANCGVLVRYDIPCREYDGVEMPDGSVLCWSCADAVQFLRNNFPEKGLAE